MPLVHDNATQASATPLTAPLVGTWGHASGGWTARTMPLTQIYHLAWSESLLKFIAIGDTNKVVTSSDGITWSTAVTLTHADTTLSFSATTTNKVSAPPAAAAGVLAPLYGANGYSYTASSTDGVNWTVVRMGLSTRVNKYLYSPQLARYVGLGQRLSSSGAPVSYTGDPTVANNWTTVAMGADEFIDGLWEQGLFVAITSYQVWTSPDAITWTERFVFSGGRFTGVVWSPAAAMFVAAGYNPSTGEGKIHTSTDGITWTLNVAASTEWNVAAGQDIMNGVAYLPNEQTLMAYGYGGTTAAPRAMKSEDGITWQRFGIQPASPFNQHINGSYCQGGTTTLAISGAHLATSTNPLALPSGAVVIIVQQGSADQVTGVTYGGVVMTRVRRQIRGSGELGTVYIYFLGEGLPAGTQAVNVNGPASMNAWNAVCSTVAGTTRGTIVDSDFGADAGIVANPSLAIMPTWVPAAHDPAPVYYGLYSGLAAPVTTPEAGSTHQFGADFGQSSAMWARKVTSGDTTIGYTASSDDVCHAAVVLDETPVMIGGWQVGSVAV